MYRKFPTKRAYDTIRDPLKTVSNSECRPILYTTVVFLIVVDYYSEFPFVKELHNLTAGAVVNEMKIPKSLQCDNGTWFTSGVFQQLASPYGFEILRSSPYYPHDLNMQ